MKTETNEKVLAMYQAVCALLEEGCDIHRIKVSDITARAGIGKGTAYEYFRSKEELLAKALQYDFTLQYQLLEGEVKQKRSLWDAMYSSFDWLEKNTARKRFAMQFLKLTREMEKGGEGFGSGIDCMMQQMDCGVEMFRQILKYMVALGRSEGVIASGVPEKMAQLELFSKFMGFFVYLQMGEPENKEEIRQTKRFLYDNIVKSLGDFEPAGRTGEA